MKIAVWFHNNCAEYCLIYLLMLSARKALNKLMFNVRLFNLLQVHVYYKFSGSLTFLWCLIQLPHHVVR